MKEYFKNNLEPILVGFVIAVFTIFLFNLVSDIIVKIAIVQNRQHARLPNNIHNPDNRLAAFRQVQ